MYCVYGIPRINACIFICSMDGFKVVRIEEVLGQIDILITATGIVPWKTLTGMDFTGGGAPPSLPMFLVIGQFFYRACA